MVHESHPTGGRSGGGAAPEYITPWILAADPRVTGPGRLGRPITTQVRLPHEHWAPGPIGTRVQLVDFDTSAGGFYGAIRFDESLLVREPTEDDLRSASYHACNLFATAMATIAQFERALGRRISYRTDTHQIKLAPHAFVGANAYYDRDNEAVVFGYFPGRCGDWVDTCLSYDVIVHEMTHAILDGLRPRFCDPSSRDQAAFHEAFADLVAILSTLTRREVVDWAVREQCRIDGHDDTAATLAQILRALSTSFVVSIAPQLGEEMPVRHAALRQSFALVDAARSDPCGQRSAYRDRRDGDDPHALGEVLVAAVLTAFRELLTRRLHDVMPQTELGVATPIELVADEAARAADLLLTICIQAIDYTPPVHVEFPDYLSALLTVHRELHGTSGCIDVAAVLVESFASVGITPAEGGPWRRLDEARGDGEELDYSGVRFDEIHTDRDEAFRFVFANLAALDLDPQAYTRVLSVRPSTRVSPDDGFIVHETVIECLQRLRMTRDELRRTLGAPNVGHGDGDDPIDLRGGTTLVLADNGRVKYSIHKRPIPRRAKRAAADRIGYLEELRRTGWITSRADPDDFAELHRLAGRHPPAPSQEAW